MELKYGKSFIELPDNIASRSINLKLKLINPLSKIEQNIKNALIAPTSGNSLRETVKRGERVGIIVNDSTRIARTEIILPFILEELGQAGVPDDDIFIIFAEGLHRQTTDAEKVEIVGKEIASRLKLYNHDAHDSSVLVNVGTTKRGTKVHINRHIANCDKRIVVGSINYHFFAGFGGGHKSIVPGLAGAETIKSNHSLMLDSKARLGNLRDNPVHEDLKEAASIVGCDFMINVVLNENKEILAIFSGDIDEAHKEGCDYVADVYGVEINELGDIVIASCGGYPKDINVYQAQKTLENASQAAKSGGSIILVAKCSEGAGSEKYLDWARKYKTLSEIEKALKADFQMGGHKAFAVSRVTSSIKVFMLTDLDSNLTTELGFEKCYDIEDVFDDEVKKAIGKPLIYVMPEGSITTPIYKPIVTA